MKKLIRGIVDFRTRLLPERRDQFAHLARKGQHPDALFITCSDSRVAPNWFASTDPGDLFVVRNVGNLICPCGSEGVTVGDESELAAVEFALVDLKVSDIIVCGHSDCGAMRALLAEGPLVEMPHLQSWLRHGKASLQKWKVEGPLSADFDHVNQLSQINVIQQLEHLKSYALVRERLAGGSLNLHAWWFDIARADVLAFDSERGHFSLIDG